MSVKSILHSPVKAAGLWRSIALALCCYALTRLPPVGDLRPFGLALLAVRFSTPAGMLIPALGVLLGSFGGRYALFGTGISLCVLTLCGIWGGERFSRLEHRIVCLCVAVFLGGSIRWAGNGFLFYDLFLLLFATAAAGLCGLAVSRLRFSKALDFASALTDAAVLVLVGVGLFGGDFCGVLTCFLALIFAAHTDPERGVLSGAILGLCLGLATEGVAQTVFVLTLSSLAASLLFPRGRMVGALGFLLGVSVCGFWVFGTPLKNPGVFHALPGVVLFSLLPTNIRLRLSHILSDTAEGGTVKLHRFLNHRVLETGDAFLRLAEVYRGILNSNSPKTDLALFERVRGSVCMSCSLSEVCWNRDLYRTRETAEGLLKKLDDVGTVDKADLSDRLRRRCPHTDAFLSAVNHAYDLDAQLHRHQRHNSRTCAQVAGQFHTVSKILIDLSDELSSEFVRYPSLEHQLYDRLRRGGRRVADITVLKNRYDRFEVTIRLRSCEGTGDCAAITRSVSKLLGVTLQKDPTPCHKGECTLHLCEQETFSVLVGAVAAVKPGEDQCGDHHLVLPLRDGRFLLAISDGMGSGPAAAEESGAVIALLGSFLTAGFDPNLAVRLINSALLLRGGEEMFATIDMALLDLFSGTVEWIKIGCCDSYLKCGGKVEVIPSTSLPVGIMEVPDVEHTRRRLRNGDWLILVSDGVIEAFGGTEGLHARLQQIDGGESPKRLARELLEEAKVKPNPHPDDMTLILAQITV